MRFTYVHTSDGEFVHLSPQFETLLGYGIHEAHDEHYSKIVHSSQDLQQIEQLTSANTTHAINQYEVKLSRSNGQAVCVIIQERKIEKNDGATGIQGVATTTEEYYQEFAQLFLHKSKVSYALSSVVLQNNVQQCVESITLLFETKLQYRGVHDKWTEIGRDVFMSRVKFFIERQEKVHFVLPAFPFKSNNTEKKVLGKYPDKGEELAMTTLRDFVTSISQVYDKGGKLTIVSDGRVFSDILQVPEDNVTVYNAEIREMIQNGGTVKDLEHFFDCDDHQHVREKLVQIFSRLDDKIIKQRIRDDAEFRKMYLGFSRFVLEDIYSLTDGDKISAKQATTPQGESKITSNGIKRESKKRAKEMMKRNDAYSEMIAALFPLHIRLSIHAHDNSGSKFAVRLIAGDVIDKELADQNAHIPTPWHNVVVEDSQGLFKLMKHYRAMSEEAELVYYENGRPSHYKLN
jgi:PAS domain S-box-containing protein